MLISDTLNFRIPDFFLLISDTLKEGAFIINCVVVSFNTIVSIDRVSGQHADQSKWLTDAEMCICSGGRRTGIGSSPYPHFKYFTGGKNDQVVLPWTAC